MSGRVYLVGCGPGAADLLTVRAARVIAQADVVLHDSLVTAEILSLARPGARVLRVGRRAGEGGTDAEWVGRLLVREARAGAVAVRLHGGDPSLFGRMAEEISFLRAANLEFEVVPGVTAALAAAAELGVPLTRRGVATGVRFVAGCNEEAIRAAGPQGDTLAFYMAGRQAACIARALMSAGRGADTPALTVHGTSLPGSRTRRTTLGALARRRARPTKRPALLLVGEALAEVTNGRDSRSGGRGVPDDLDAHAPEARADGRGRDAGGRRGRRQARPRVSP